MDSFWEVFWWTVSIFFFMAYLIVLLNVTVDLFRDRELSGWWKAVWVFFLILVPVLTSLVHLIVRGGSMAHRSAEQLRAQKAQTDAYIRDVAKSPADKIASARSVLDAGAITPDEYERLKARVLA